MPVEYFASMPGGIGPIYRASALRWAGTKQSTDKSLSAVIDTEGSFNFTSIHRAQLFKKGSSEVKLVP